MLKVLSVGLGPLGQRIAADLERRGLGRVVAALDQDPERVGKDLAEVAPGTAGGFPVRRVPGEVEGLEILGEGAIAGFHHQQFCHLVVCNPI